MHLSSIVVLWFYIFISVYQLVYLARSRWKHNAIKWCSRFLSRIVNSLKCRRLYSINNLFLYFLQSLLYSNLFLFSLLCLSRFYSLKILSQNIFFTSSLYYFSVEVTFLNLFKHDELRLLFVSLLDFTL